MSISPPRPEGTTLGAPAIGCGSTTPFRMIRTCPVRSVKSMSPDGRNASENGRDNLFGQGNGDFIDGGAGNDNIFGDDFLPGATDGDDWLLGGVGLDHIYANGGNDYVDAGVSKFVLCPAAQGDDAVLAQTRRLIDEVLPRVAARWPRTARAQ